jgi:glycosyltransferase involved in cell wall biosynthesis
MLECSVIICTLNPRIQVLQRVLQALQGQTLPLEQWQLIVVDNGSQPDLRSQLDLSWHPHAQCVREERPGQLAARVCGYRCSAAELLVYVDDDNVLAADYLAQCVALSAEHPDVAVWSGQSSPEFQQPPAEWTRRWWPMLAIAQFSEDEVMTQWQVGQPLPHGAGMAVRREVMKTYVERYYPAPLRSSLGRTQRSLMSADDNDITLCALNEGWSCGRFTQLQLTHIIPPQRLTQEYLLRLTAGMAASRVVLSQLYPQFPYAAASARPFGLRYLWHFCSWPGFERSRQLALLAGEKQGREHLRSMAATEQCSTGAAGKLQVLV